MDRRIAVAALLALCGCQKMADALSQPPQKLTSTDGTLTMTVPGTWIADKLNDQAVLQASNRAAELYVIVLSEAKEDLTDMDLAKFSEITRSSQLQSMKNGKEEGPVKRTIGGLPALEYVLKGSVDNANVVMKHVSVEGSKRFHQVLVWTLKSKWDAEAKGLDAVIDSLKENGGGGGGARAPAPN